MTKCIDCEHGPCYIHMTNNNWIELRKEYIHKFCNDHNGEVRWLRGIFMDDDDAIEEHLTFISNLLIQKDQEHKAELESIKGEIDKKEKSYSDMANSMYLQGIKTNNKTSEYFVNAKLSKATSNAYAICSELIKHHINKLSTE